MPPKKGAKRKAVVALDHDVLSTKRARHTPSSTSPGSDDTLRRPHPFWKEADENGIVLRKYYPHEMSNERARAYTNNEIPRPIELLNAALQETAEGRRQLEVRDAVVHWFKMDLRTSDNYALHMASKKANEAGVPLIALYIVSPQDFEAHLTSPVRVDFMFRCLEILKQDLAKLDIPLYIETVERRRDIPRRIVELMEEWGASHLFANIEYEVDELRREATLVRMCADRRLTMEMFHDTCVVPPGQLHTGTGKQYAVYTPWYRTWVHHVHQNLELLELFDPPSENSAAARRKFGSLFDCQIPKIPTSKALSQEEQKRFHALWPAGEREALKRLDKFCEEKATGYDRRRNIPSDVGTSSLSVHLASGTLSARTAVQTARERNKTQRLDGGNSGISTWISEVAWRDFYKHVLVNWPYVCMNKPFKPEYSNIEWSYNADHFAAWCEGRTGFPLVDAAMRQLAATGWMHNRCRMVAASFLAKDLLVDWRMGERFFMERLVDGDFASNNGGWGFAASVGVDPQPYFRVFNPLLQSEKFDPDGEYIRRWVPELEGVTGTAVHDPYARGAGPLVKKRGYPRMIVEHKGRREQALKAYKEGIERDI